MTWKRRGASYSVVSRRRFRSQTSDNMEGWKSRGGKSQGGEVKKWEDQRRERVRNKKMQVRKKVGKSLWREARFQVKKPKALQVRITFWKLRCRKSARRCGAKHISESKCTKHTSSGPRLEVEMSKKCTPLWREVHFQVKMYKAHHSRTAFGSWDVEKVHAVVARSAFPSQNVQSTPCSEGVDKVHHVVARSTFPSQKWKKQTILRQTN